MAATDVVYESQVLDIANFKFDNRRMIGHLSSIKVGGEELKTDFNFFDPMSPGSRVPLAGMITCLQWDKKPGGILMIEGRISAANQGVMQDAMGSHDKTALCEFKLDFYKYDYATKTYYKCFHTDGAAIEGQLSEEAPSSVADEVADEYRQIANHRFVLNVIGSDEKDQLLHIAFDPERKKTFPFGQKAKA